MVLFNQNILRFTVFLVAQSLSVRELYRSFSVFMTDYAVKEKIHSLFLRVNLDC